MRNWCRHRASAAFAYCVPIRTTRNSHGLPDLRRTGAVRALFDLVDLAPLDAPLAVAVALSRFAGETILLELQHSANDWHNEWAYWNNVAIVSE